MWLPQVFFFGHVTHKVCFYSEYRMGGMFDPPAQNTILTIKTIVAKLYVYQELLSNTPLYWRQKQQKWEVLLNK